MISEEELSKKVDLSSDSESTITQMRLDIELLLHQKRLQQLLEMKEDEGDETYLDQDPHLLAIQPLSSGNFLQVYFRQEVKGTASVTPLFLFTSGDAINHY